LIRGLVYSLVEHGRIKTTLARAKEVRRHVERAITVGKRDSLHSRRLLMSRFPNENVVELIATDLQKRFAKRPGGYTRIVKIGARTGDQADMAFLEFVDYVPPQTTGEETVKGDKEAPKRARARTVARERSRKTVRRLQSAARRESRA
jgi:large subunit ribosomal protein L17